MNISIENIDNRGQLQRFHTVSPGMRACSRPRPPLRIVMVLFVAIVLVGCAAMDQLVQKPNASFSGMRIGQADLVKGTAIFHFNVSNPNPISIRTGRITYNLKLDQRHVVSGALDQGMTLAAQGTSRLNVPITLQYLDFFDSLSELWKAKGADYALTGGFAVGPFTIPFQAHGRFDLPKMPKISLENVKIAKLTLSGARLNCRLKMDNSNAFQLALKRLDYHLVLGNRSFARASALPDGPIAANGTTTLDFGFDISFAQLGQSAYQLLLGANADYRMDGAMVFEAADGKVDTIPIKAAGRVPFLR